MKLRTILKCSPETEEDTHTFLKTLKESWLANYFQETIFEGHVTLFIFDGLVWTNESKKELAKVFLDSTDCHAMADTLTLHQIGDDFGPRYRFSSKFWKGQDRYTACL